MSKVKSGTATRGVSIATDVAKLAGVSQSAVSRAFTEGASISEKTRKKVVEAAQALGYRPNHFARSLSTRRSRTVGVVIGYLDNGFYPAFLEALSARLHAIGYRILLFTTDIRGGDDPSLEEVLQFNVDILVMASTVLTSGLAEECRRAGTPVIMFNRTTGEDGAWSVTGDNLNGGRTIAEFLCEARHERFGFIAGIENSSTSRDREAGFTRSLAELRGISPVRATGNYTFSGALDATRSLLNLRFRPDAIFCANDHMALAAIEVARSEFGLAVGRDISIVGFDNVAMADWPSHGLTTYSQPLTAMIDQLMLIIEGVVKSEDFVAEAHVVPGRLVLRSSARLPGKGVHQDEAGQYWISPT